MGNQRCLGAGLPSGNVWSKGELSAWMQLLQNRPDREQLRAGICS